MKHEWIQSRNGAWHNLKLVKVFYVDKDEKDFDKWVIYYELDINLGGVLKISCDTEEDAIKYLKDLIAS